MLDDCVYPDHDHDYFGEGLIRLLKKFIVVFCLGLISTIVFSQQHKLGYGYDFAQNGKISRSKFSQLYTKETPALTTIEITANSLKAAKLNIKVLKRISAKKQFKYGNLKVSGKKLKETGQLLFKRLQKNKYNLLKDFELYQIKGEDNCGNIHFTGYFTPVLKVRKTPDKTFKYPIYAMPRLKKIPSRKAIDQHNALAGKNLELAYSNSLLENYFLQVQGSGILDFGNKQRKPIGYAGQNGHAYKSLGKMLVNSGAVSAEKISLKSIRAWFAKHPQKLQPMLNKNPSYTFFKFRKSEITGATGVSLTPMHSVAVDKKYIPYGACLLAEVPVLNSKGVLIAHKWRLLFAHDTGGAIRGPGHLDLYHGFGKEAGEKAGDLHHYGRIWLILAR